MTAEQLLADPKYRVTTDLRFNAERMRGGDGYDVMDAVAKSKWRTIGGWGADGWNLGDWPYVVIYVREQEGYELAYYVEGDVTTYRFNTADMRRTAIDGLALFHWLGLEHGPDVGNREHPKYATVEQLPARFRGPYRETAAA